MKPDIIDYFERKVKRPLDDGERAALGTLLLADEFDDSPDSEKLPKDRRKRLRVFEKARRKARREAIANK